MSCFIAIKLPKDDYANNMLLVSLSFIHPIKRTQNPGEFLMYDCNNEQQMHERLNHLCEASGVDFNFKYKFV